MTNKADLSTLSSSRGIFFDAGPPVVSKLDVLSARYDNQGYVQTSRSSITLRPFISEPGSGLQMISVALKREEGIQLDSMQITDLLGVVTYHETFTYHCELSVGSSYSLCVSASDLVGHVSMELCQSLRIVDEETPGFILPLGGTGISPSTSISAMVSDFASDLCGIVEAEWGVGSRAGLDDLRAYTWVPMTPNILYLHDSMKLREHYTYFITVRFLTGCGRELVTSSRGITVSLGTPSIKDILLLPKSHFVSNALATADLRWSSSQADGLLSIFQVPFPRSSDTHLISQIAVSSEQVSFSTGAIDHGTAAVLSPFVTWGPNFELPMRTFLAFVFDSSPPSLGNIFCDPFVETGVSSVTCVFDNFTDLESGIQSYQIVALIYVNSTIQPVQMFTQNLSAGAKECFLPLSRIQGKLFKDISQVDVTVTATNRVGRSSAAQTKVQVTAPLTDWGSVWITTSHGKTTPACITQNLATVHYVLTDTSVFGKLKIHIGRFPGDDSLGITTVDAFYHSGQIEVTFDTVLHGDEIFATLIALSVGGNQYAVVSQSVVFWVPSLADAVVFDGLESGDLIEQMNNEEISAHWRWFSPCRIVNVSFHVTSNAMNASEVFVGGEIGSICSGTCASSIRAFSVQTIQHDSLNLGTDVTYFVHVIITDESGAINDVVSDGVTIKRHAFSAGTVFDGPLHYVDQDSQAELNTLSASWNGFGNVAKIRQVPVARYFVCFGTDPSVSSSVSDVVEWTYVGRNTFATFTVKNLVSGRRYYATVRADTADQRSSFAQSDGIVVGISAPLIGGYMTIPSFFPSTNVLFQFALPATPKQAPHFSLVFEAFCKATSILQECVCLNIKDGCKQAAVCKEGNPSRQVSDSLAQINGHAYLMSHGLFRVKAEMPVCDGEYNIQLHVRNDALVNITLNSNTFRVDTSPPYFENVIVSNVRLQDTAYVHPQSTPLILQLLNASDDDSGLLQVDVAVLELDPRCTVQSLVSELTILIDGNTDLSRIVAAQAGDLRSGKEYQVTVTVFNGAHLSTSRVSSAFLLGSSKVVPGKISVGRSWVHPQLFSSSTNSVQINWLQDCTRLCFPVTVCFTTSRKITIKLRWTRAYNLCLVALPGSQTHLNWLFLKVSTSHLLQKRREHPSRARSWSLTVHPTTFLRLQLTFLFASI